jgi:hypothetical protein
MERRVGTEREGKEDKEEGRIYACQIFLTSPMRTTVNDVKYRKYEICQNAKY